MPILVLVWSVPTWTVVADKPAISLFKLEWLKYYSRLLCLWLACAECSWMVW